MTDTINDIIDTATTLVGQVGLVDDGPALETRDRLGALLARLRVEGATPLEVGTAAHAMLLEEPAPPPPESLAGLLAEALEAEREAFESGGDVDVDSQALLEFFEGWRRRLKLALADHQPTSSFGVVRALMEAIDKANTEVDAHWTREDLEARHCGMEVARDKLAAARDLGDAYLRSAAIANNEAITPEAVVLYALVDAINFIPAAAQAMAEDETFKLALALTDGKTPDLRIGVTINGGLVQSVFGNFTLPGLDVTVIDYDTEGSQSPPDQVRQRDGSYEDACVTRYSIDTDPSWEWDIRLANDVEDEEQG